MPAGRNQCKVYFRKEESSCYGVNIPSQHLLKISPNMKIKNALSLLVGTLILGIVVAGCGKSEPYSDVVSTTDDFTASYQSFETDLGAASDAKQAAAALDAFANSLDKLIPKMQELKAKYPELDQRKEELPRKRAGRNAAHGSRNGRNGSKYDEIDEIHAEPRISGSPESPHVRLRKDEGPGRVGKTSSPKSNEF